MSSVSVRLVNHWIKHCHWKSSACLAVREQEAQTVTTGPIKKKQSGFKGWLLSRSTLLWFPCSVARNTLNNRT